LQLVRRLSLHIENTSRLIKYVQLPRAPTHLNRQDTTLSFWQVECCPQPFVRFTQRLLRLFYACRLVLQRLSRLRRPIATGHTVKELSALNAEYNCIISRLFSASSANSKFLKIKRSSEKSDDLLYVGRGVVIIRGCQSIVLSQNQFDMCVFECSFSHITVMKHDILATLLPLPNNPYTCTQCPICAENPSHGF
jgi:hypothetical protein